MREGRSASELRKTYGLRISLTSISRREHRVQSHGGVLVQDTATILAPDNENDVGRVNNEVILD